MATIDEGFEKHNICVIYPENDELSIDFEGQETKELNTNLIEAVEGKLIFRIRRIKWVTFDWRIPDDFGLHNLDIDTHASMAIYLFITFFVFGIVMIFIFLTFVVTCGSFQTWNTYK